MLECDFDSDVGELAGMARKHGPWTIEGSTEKHRDEFMEVVEDRVVRPDGEPGTFTVTRMLPGVSILALDEEGFAYLTREFRYAVGRESLEVVSGAIDEGEEPLEAARRELREELGIRADEWTDMGTVDALTSQVWSPVRIFLARRLTFGKSEQEGVELIEPVRMRFEEALRAVLESRITHSLSCVLILKTRLRLGAG
jgi:8-oxo-dGTP pyrophosphatase MutT (NUDIX family)